MLSTPCDYSLSSSSKYKEILNSFSIEISKFSIKKILKPKENQISNFHQCPACKAILSENLVKIPNSGKFQCKFCEEPLEFPKAQLKEMALMNEDKAYYLDVDKLEIKAKANPSILIVICMDYSGSMNMSYIPSQNSFGKEFLTKKKIPEEYKAFLKEYLEISRKELVLINLEKQLKLLLDSNSQYNYQIFVITFSSDITLYGNGTKQNFSVTLNQNFFNDKNECVKFGKENALKVFEKNKDSNLKYLFETLHEKEPNGTTPLGPAIACGLGVIQAIKPDLSQFYIITDGLANNGIGDMTNIVEANKIFAELADSGLELGVIFHVIGFEDENSKLNIVKELTERSADGRLERIKTPFLKEEKGQKVYTYDEKHLEKLLNEALTVSANTYGILSKLKIYSMQNIKLTLCKDSALNYKEKNNGKLKKIIGNISEEPNNIAAKYKILNDGDKKLYFQFQLVFTRPENGQKFFIVMNYSSKIEKSFEYKDVNLTNCNSILINDSFEKNEHLYNPYLTLLYECMHRAKNQTSEQAEKVLKDYIYKIYNKGENMKIFENAEKKVIELIEDEKKIEVLKLKEKEIAIEALKKKQMEEALKKEKEKIIVQDDDDEDNEDEKTINKNRMKKKVQKQKVEEEKSEEDEENTLNKKIKIVKKK